MRLCLGNLSIPERKEKCQLYIASSHVWLLFFISEALAKFVTGCQFVDHFWPIGNKEDKESLKAEKNRLDLRNKVRKEMGLDSTDFLVVALSSINPGKGQLMLIQAALMVEEGIEDEGLEGLRHVDPISLDESGSTGCSGNALRKLFGLRMSVNHLLGRLRLGKEMEKARKEKGGDSSCTKAEIPGKCCKYTRLKILYKMQIQFRQPVVLIVQVFHFEEDLET
jgi:hypothetical protein